MKTSTVVSLLGGGIGILLGARALRAVRAISFDGRVVVITGGSRGLGLLVARLLASEGARLALIARDPAELQRASIDLEERGSVPLTIPCDVGDRAQAEGAIQQVVQHFGRIDVIVNDAGTIEVGPVEHMMVADFESAMRVHFWGPLYLTLAALPHLRQTTDRSGRVVNISSIGGRIAVPHLLPYCASKFALTGLSDGLRAELSKDGIRVTTVLPGLMRTGSPYNAWFKGTIAPSSRGSRSWTPYRASRSRRSEPRARSSRPAGTATRSWPSPRRPGWPSLPTPSCRRSSPGRCN